MRAVVTASDRSPAIEDVPPPTPATGEAVIRIAFSSLNYKDGMALARDPGVARVDPLIPGIDAVGTIVDFGPQGDDQGRLHLGDRVVLNGSGLGETRAGGWAEYAAVPVAPLVVLDANMPEARAAAIGTAGFTAALSVLALSRHVAPEDGPILVTGASGGVGSIAIPLLAARGYNVTASTGSPDQEDSLRTLGATGVIDRSTIADPGRPLQRAIWAGAVDCVGGRTLANVLASTKWGGAVTACGLVQDTALPTTVLPFILRAVSLLGVNSVDAPLPLRQEAWDLLTSELDPALLDAVTTTVDLRRAVELGPAILAGRVKGRTVVAPH